MPFTFRVPVHPEDAAVYRQIHEQNLRKLEEAKQRQAERQKFYSEPERLGRIAAFKRHADRMQGSGPVDQEANIRWANKMNSGMEGSPLRSLAEAVDVPLQQLNAWSSSEPDTRNVFVQALMAPEHMVMHTAGALRTPGGMSQESLSRLAAAPVASFFPDAGYPLEPEREAMYSRLDPVTGFLVDTALMPGPDEAGKAIRALTMAAR